MVERNGDIIAFNPDEQAEFNVAPEVTVESAMHTADSFRITAAKLYESVPALASNGLRQAHSQVAARIERITRLSNMAANIDLLCAAERVAQMMETFEDPKTK